MNNQQLENILKIRLPIEYLEIQGDGHHFFIRIVSSAFSGKNRLERHRLVKDSLKKELTLNKLHALSRVSALTPEEWQNRRAEVD